MSILAALKSKTLELRKNRDELAGAFQGVMALATASAKERGLKSGDMTVTEDDAIRAINKSIKQVNDTLKLAPNDEKSKRELEILLDFLPKQASEDEIRAEVVKFVEASGEKSPKLMGPLMAHLNATFGLSLDKGKASTIAKEVLAS